MLLNIISRWIYGCVIFWPQVATSSCKLLAMTGTAITVLVPISACLECVFARSYDIRQFFHLIQCNVLQWTKDYKLKFRFEFDKDQEVVYLMRKGRRQPILKSNKAQISTENQTEDSAV